MSQVTVKALDHLVLTVRNMEESLGFYTEVLGMAHEPFEGTDGTTRHALTFGAQKINLHQAGAEFAPHAQSPTAGSADLCLLIEGSVTAAAEALGGLVEEGPIRRTGSQGPILSIYLRDPDGNLLELSERL